MSHESIVKGMISFLKVFLFYDIMSNDVCEIDLFKFFKG